MMRQAHRALSLLAAALGCFLSSPPGLARFEHPDANQIDREENLASEGFIDGISYDWLPTWNDTWDALSLGWRVSAGSLDADRFDYREEIKITSPADKSFVASFRRERHEDVIEHIRGDEVRLANRSFAPFEIGLLAEGGSAKKWGDFGGFFAVDSYRDRVELWYAAVDLFYNTKEDELPEDRYLTAARSAGLRANFTVSNLELHLDLSRDFPFTLDQPSRDSVYSGQRTSAELDATWNHTPLTQFRLRLELDQKQEERVTTDDATADGKGLQRDVVSIDLRWLDRSAPKDTSAHVTTRQWILAATARDADYTYTGDFDPDNSIPQRGIERFSPDSRRREWLLGRLWHTPISQSSGEHFFQYGALVSRPQINRSAPALGLSKDDDKDLANTEIKGQTAWDYRFAPGCGILVNANWNIDRLIRNWPYRDQEFRPWNGGNLQIMASF